jgi:hypothetical protein
MKLKRISKDVVNATLDIIKPLIIATLLIPFAMVPFGLVVVVVGLDLFQQAIEEGKTKKQRDEHYCKAWHLPPGKEIETRNGSMWDLKLNI